VVINDLDIVCITSFPGEADTPLIVDPDAVLSYPAPFLHGLQPVAGQGCQIVKAPGPMQQEKLPSGRPFKSPECSDGPVLKQRCRPLAPEDRRI
jgi:hypothetical protein